MEALLPYLKQGPTVVAFVLTCLIGKFFWKEYTALCVSHKEDIKNHKKDFASVIDRTITCIDKNTEANTKLSESIHNLRR